MNSKQLQVGNSSEEAICQLLKKYRFWAHIMQKSTSGQPVDIVALRGGQKGDKWLIDAKHLEKDKKSFPFSRIEANQVVSLDYARNFSGVENLGFVICVDNEDKDDGYDYYYLSYDVYREYALWNGKKSIKLSELEDFECKLKLGL